MERFKSTTIDTLTLKTAEPTESKYNRKQLSQQSPNKPAYSPYRCENKVAYEKWV